MCTMRLFIGSPFRLIYQPAARLRGVGNLGRQREVDVLLDEAGLRDGRAAALEENHGFVHQPLGRGGRGGAREGIPPPPTPPSFLAASSRISLMRGAGPPSAPAPLQSWFEFSLSREPI